MKIVFANREPITPRSARRSIAPFFAAALSILFSGTAVSQTVTSYSCVRSGKTYTIQTSDESPRSQNDTGYRQYDPSCQSLIDSHWKKFGMEKSYWDQGWGFEDACNIKLPLNRTFRALEELKISGNITLDGLRALAMGTYTPPANEFSYLSIVYQGLDDSENHLRAGCVFDKEPDAFAVFNRDDNNITLYIWAFGQSVVDLGGTLVHEALHRWKPHDARCPYPPESGISGTYKCDSSWDYQGAFTHEVWWLWSYSQAAARTQKYLRTRALDKAKYETQIGFVTNPNFNWPVGVPDLPAGW